MNFSQLDTYMYLQICSTNETHTIVTVTHKYALPTTLLIRKNDKWQKVEH